MIDADLRAGRQATERMLQLHKGDDASPVQTDLRLDVDLTLPDEVAREAERAATVLWRLSAPVAAPWLPGYHERFLERYGTERAVPVTELLADTGLGLPRWDEAVPAPGPDEERTPVLAEELLAATRERRTEIVLDDALVERLAVDEPAPPSMELCVEVLADGWERLCAGEFRLVVGQSLGSALAGTTVARFAHLLPELDAELTELVRAGAPADGVRAAQVAFRPLVPRSVNVAAVPQRLPLRIPLAPGTVDASVTDLPLHRLAVTATTERLHLVDTATGTRIAPVSGSMLNPRSGHVPPVARFLLELGAQDTPQCAPWSWGVLAAAPYLPRVRHGRTVLAPARWLPPTELGDAALPADRWARRLAGWRERWAVPRHVRLTVADNHIPVDLDDPLHQLVFRDELRRHPQLVVLESPTDAGWLRGPRGTHTCEVVVQLLGRRGEPAAPVVARPVPQRESDLLQLPGGEWLYAKLYATEPAQRAVLRSRLPELVDEAELSAAGVDGWFYVRYRDPDPHLRLRFHGKPDGLWGELLPRLHGWATRLRQEGLLITAVLDSYDPEVERYGGPEAMADAERVFHADSALALVLAPHLDGDDADVRAAASVHDLLVGLDPSGGVLTRFAAAVPVADRHAVPAARRGRLADLLPASAGRLVAPGGFRRGALAAYAATLERTGCPPGRLVQIGAGLAHMHCNRLFGVDRARERGVYALLHRALAVRASRARHGR
jgi:thiopeptide-type bacteriocin biosynthesis protein